MTEIVTPLQICAISSDGRAHDFCWGNSSGRRPRRKCLVVASSSLALSAKSCGPEFESPMAHHVLSGTISMPSYCICVCPRMQHPSTSYDGCRHCWIYWNKTFEQLSFRKVLKTVYNYVPIDKWSKSSPFHGGVTGSNPVGDTMFRGVAKWHGA